MQRGQVGSGSALPEDMVIRLNFHEIGDSGATGDAAAEGYRLTASVFEQMLDVVADHPETRLSFDDGNASDVSIALPALLKRGLTASFFPAIDHIDQPGGVQAAGLRELVDNGMTIGTHGVRHRPWRGLSEDALRHELIVARLTLEDLVGVSVSTAACPLGSYDRQTLRQLRYQGYVQVFTSDRSPANRYSWLQPRYSVRAHNSVDDVRAIVCRPPDRFGRAVGRARTFVKSWR